MAIKELAPDVIGDSIIIKASPKKIWDIIIDLNTINDRNHQCIKMIPLSADKTVRPGLRTLNVNKHGWLYWFTTTTIKDFEPEKTFSFRVNLNKMIWKYELEPQADGTVRVTESRDGTRRQEWEKKLHDVVWNVLGGAQAFTQEMYDGIVHTLQVVKQLAEKP